MTYPNLTQPNLSEPNPILTEPNRAVPAVLQASDCHARDRRAGLPADGGAAQWRAQVPWVAEASWPPGNDERRSWRQCHGGGRTGMPVTLGVRQLGRWPSRTGIQVTSAIETARGMYWGYGCCGARLFPVMR